MLYELAGQRPILNGTAHFIAPNATVIGQVVLENEVGLWFNTVLRGDSDLIHIGEGSNIQDGAVLHTDEGIQLRVGAGVTVGHKAMLHGCEIGENSLIGMNAVVLNKAKIGKGCIIGANSLVTEGTVIPDYSLVVGSPGKVVKQLNPDTALKMMRKSAQIYIGRLHQYNTELIPIAE